MMFLEHRNDKIIGMFINSLCILETKQGRGLYFSIYSQTTALPKNIKHGGANKPPSKRRWELIWDSGLHYQNSRMGAYTKAGDLHASNN